MSDATANMGFPGIFTPTAAVLCLPCHGPEPRPREWATRDMLRAADEALEGVTQCQRCGKAICVRSDVANVLNVGWGVSKDFWTAPWGGWEMQQTGGMCCALMVDLPGKHVAVVTDVDALCVSLWINEEAWHACGENDENPIKYQTCTSVEDAVKLIGVWASEVK